MRLKGIDCQKKGLEAASLLYRPTKTEAFANHNQPKIVLIAISKAG